MAKNITLEQVKEMVDEYYQKTNSTPSHLFLTQDHFDGKWTFELSKNCMMDVCIVPDMSQGCYHFPVLPMVGELPIERKKWKISLKKPIVKLLEKLLKSLKTSV